MMRNTCTTTYLAKWDVLPPLTLCAFKLRIMHYKNDYNICTKNMYPKKFISDRHIPYENLKYKCVN